MSPQQELEWAARLESWGRAADFWRRATSIYTSYKWTQLRSVAMSLAGASREEVEERLWVHQHEHAGAEMYNLAVSLRGFYLKV